uniref:Uncharacterized protein n=1 Tax=Leersia perrieri TaxID=77586 RepID=A0A0D9UYU9_9ORYZ
MMMTQNISQWTTQKTIRTTQNSLRTADNTVHQTQCTVSIDKYIVNEADFVECFKPLGKMDAQCYLWNQEWNDKVILNLEVTEALISHDKTILNDVLVPTVLERTNVIFVPFKVSDFWCLLVVDCNGTSGRLFYVDLETDVTRVSYNLYHDLVEFLTKLKWLRKSDAFWSITPSKVLCPKNHFGFLVLSRIPHYEEIDCTSEVAELAAKVVELSVLANVELQAFQSSMPTTRILWMQNKTLQVTTDKLKKLHCMVKKERLVAVGMIVEVLSVVLWHFLEYEVAAGLHFALFGCSTHRLLDAALACYLGAPWVAAPSHSPLGTTTLTAAPSPARDVDAGDDDDYEPPYEDGDYETHSDGDTDSEDDRCRSYRGPVPRGDGLLVRFNGSDYTCPICPGRMSSRWKRLIDIKAHVMGQAKSSRMRGEWKKW